MLRQHPKFRYLLHAVKLVSIFFLLSAVLFTIGWAATVTWRDSFPAWPLNRINFVVGAIASFVGSLPLLLLGFLSFSRLRNLATPPEIGSLNPKIALEVMRGDINRKLLFIRFGHFNTRHPLYKQLMADCSGRDHIWDYHVYLRSDDPREVAYLQEFFDFSADRIPVKSSMENSVLVDISPFVGKNEYDRFLLRYDLLGYSDVILTGTYSSEGGLDSPPLSPDRLRRDLLKIEHIAVFIKEPIEARFIPKSIHGRFFEELQAISREREGVTTIVFPRGGSVEQGSFESPVEKARELVQRIADGH